MPFARFKYWLYLLVGGLLSLPIQAQISGTVNLTAADQGGQTWINGTVSYVFQPSPSYSGVYYWNNVPLASQYLTPTTVALNGSGFGTFTMPASSNITPAGTTWKITVCPNASSVVCTVVYYPSIAGTQDISQLITANSPAIKLNPTPMPLAYSDTELQLIPNQGGIYFNTTAVKPKYYDGSAWQFFGTGGGGVPGGANHSMQFNANGSFGGTSFTGIPKISTTADPVAATSLDLAAINGFVTNPVGNQSVTYQPTFWQYNDFHNWGLGNGPPGDGGSAAIFDNCVFDAYTGDTGGGSVNGATQCHGVLNLSTVPGWSWGFTDSSGSSPYWMVTANLQAAMTVSSAGITNGFLAQIAHFGVGDTNGLDIQTDSGAGCVTPSDECMTGIQNKMTFIGLETGVVTSGSSGATSIGTTIPRAGTGAIVLDTHTAINTTQTLIGPSTTPLGLETVTLGITMTPATAIGRLVSNVIPARLPNNAPSPTTFGVTLASAYTGSVGDYVTIAAVGSIETTRIISIGSYSGGVQTITVGLHRPFLSSGINGSEVCFGGSMQGYYIEDTSHGGNNYFSQVICPLTATTADVGYIIQGNLTNYAETGNVTIYPGAEIQYFDWTTHNMLLFPNNAAWTVGDNILVPEGISQRVTNANFGVDNNHNPYLNFTGMWWPIGSVPLKPFGQGSQYFSIPGFGVDSTIRNGGTGVLPDVFNIGNGATGGIGVFAKFGNPPGDGWSFGNFEPAALLLVGCNAGPTLCNQDYFIHYDRDQTTGGIGDFGFNRTTLTYHIDGATLTIGGSTACTPANGLCASGITLTTIGTSGAATLVGNVLNIPIYAGGGGGGTVTSFSAGNLSPLFTTSVATSTSTPALTFALTNQAAFTVFGNFTGSPAAPTFTAAPIFSAANLTSFPTFNQNTTGQAGTVNTIAGNVTFSTGLGVTGAGTIASPYVVTASGGTVTFSAITGSTNTTAPMIVGTGASLNFTGTGTINASTLLGNTWTAPGTIGGTTPGIGNFTTINASGQISILALGTAVSGTNFGSNTLSIQGSHFNVSALTDNYNCVLTEGTGVNPTITNSCGITTASTGVTQLVFGSPNGFVNTGGIAFQVNGRKMTIYEDGSALFHLVVDGARAFMFDTPVNAPVYQTLTNCNNTASPAVCVAAPAGLVQVAASATTLQINTTAVTANSRINFTYSTVGITAPSNVTALVEPYVSAITAGTSFTITLPVAPLTNPINIMYTIID